MPIEFVCPECRATLRVGDDARGKKAQCPQCGKIFELPSQIAPPSPSQAASTLSVEQSDTTFLGQSHITRGPMLPVRIDFGSVLSRGWRISSRRYGLALLGSTLFLLLNIAGGMIANAISEWGRLAVDPLSISFASTVGRILFDTWLFGGVTLFFLKLTRGQTARVADLFAGGKFLWRILGVNILIVLSLSAILIIGCGIPALIGYLSAPDAAVRDRAEDGATKVVATETPSGKTNNGLTTDESADQEMRQNPRTAAAMAGIGIGLMLVFLPVIILGIMFSQAVLLVVDRGMGSLEAMRQSIRITRGNRFTLFGLGLVLSFISFLGVLAFFIGLFFVIPVCWIIGTTAFLTMTGQMSAEPISEV
tara:strand:- start:433 stop:1524 length:1092 start_codon:yes stop_codon:yes gene_type:complete